MQDSKTYRQYADDCRRIAETMNAKDKAVMLEMAKVWDERADEAERGEKTRRRAAEIRQTGSFCARELVQTWMSNSAEHGNFVGGIEI